MKPDMGLRYYCNILHRRAWIVVFAVVLAVAGAVYRLADRPPQYQAETSILVRPLAIVPSVLDGSGLSTVQSAYRETQLNDIMQLLRSRTLFERVAEHMQGLRADDLPQRVAVRNIPGTDFLTISAVDGQPERAALIANSAAEELVNLYTRINGQRVPPLERSSKSSSVLPATTLVRQSRR